MSKRSSSSAGAEQSKRKKTLNDNPFRNATLGDFDISILRGPQILSQSLSSDHRWVIQNEFPMPAMPSLRATPRVTTGTSNSASGGFDDNPLPYHEGFNEDDGMSVVGEKVSRMSRQKSVCDNNINFFVLSLTY